MQMPPNIRPGDFAWIRPKQWLWLALACVAGTAFAATGPRPYRAIDPPLKGRLEISGSRALSRTLAGWVAIFRREHPRVEVVVMPLGSGAAAGAMADGAADVAPLTRPLRPRELRMTAQAHHHQQPLLVGHAGGGYPLYLYVNRAAKGAPSAAAVEFARVALSAEGQRHLAPFSATSGRSVRP